MRRRTRRTIGLALGLGVIVGLVACTNWFSAPGVPTLIIGAVTITDGRGEIILSVADMPGGGIASMAVMIGGLTINLATVSNVAIEGLNGFEVLASQLWGGKGGFIASHPSSGLEAGEFAKLTFTVWRDVTLADFEFREGSISLGDARNGSIAFELTDEYTYYALEKHAR